MQNGKPIEHIEGGAVPEDCLSDDLLLSYFEGMLAEEGTLAVQRHLNTCPACFQVMASLVKNSATPLSEAEKEEADRLITLTPEEQVAKILSYVKEAPLPSSPSLSVRTLEACTRSIRALSDLVFPHDQSRPLRPVYALAAVFALSLSTFWGVRFYKTTYKIILAERLLQENFQIYMAETPRLSGSYAPTGVSVPMAANRPDRPYLVSASELAEEAIANGSTSPKARQILSQIYIIQGEYNQADSIFRLVNPEAAGSATIMNDMGVLHFEKKEWQTSVDYFSAALQADPKLKEAQYNLALTKAAMGATQEAISLLHDYIASENVEGWRNAALRYKHKLEKGEY